MFKHVEKETVVINPKTGRKIVLSITQVTGNDFEQYWVKRGRSSTAERFTITQYSKEEEFVIAKRTLEGGITKQAPFGFTTAVDGFVSGLSRYFDL